MSDSIRLQKALLANGESKSSPKETNHRYARKFSAHHSRSTHKSHHNATLLSLDKLASGLPISRFSQNHATFPGAHIAVAYALNIALQIENKVLQGLTSLAEKGSEKFRNKAKGVIEQKLAEWDNLLQNNCIFFRHVHFITKQQLITVDFKLSTLASKKINIY